MISAIVWRRARVARLESERAMRTTYQRPIPVRLQHGTRQDLATHVNVAGRDVFNVSTDTVGGRKTYLTRGVLEHLRQEGRLSTRLASIARLSDTRRGRKTLRALYYRIRKGLPVTWPK